MPAPPRARMCLGDEWATIARLARSRAAPARAVERARVVLLSRYGNSVEEIGQALGVCPATVRLWFTRFNRLGVRGVADRPRPGRPPAYTAGQVGEVAAASLTDPPTLGLPCAGWALDRPAAYLAAAKDLPISRGRIGEILTAEGLRWREQEARFGERVGPAFAAQRGRSPRSTRHRPATASQPAWTSWARSRRRVCPVDGWCARRRRTGRNAPRRSSATGGGARGTSAAPFARRPGRR